MHDSIRPARYMLRACPDDFLETAHHGWNLEARLPVSALRAFDLVTTRAREWFPGSQGIRWSSRGPGPGAQREYCLSYMRVVERFTVWEPGRHLRIWISSASLPLLERYCEDYRFLDRSPSDTLVVWRVRYEPRRNLRPLRPLLSPLFARDFRLAARRLEAIAAKDRSAGTS